MTRLSRLTKADHRALHEDLRAGMPLDTLGKKYHMSAQAVRYHQHCAATDAKFTWDDPHESVQIDPTVHRKLHGWLEAGVTDEAAMRQFNLPWTIIRYHRNQHCDYLLPQPNVQQKPCPIVFRAKTKEEPPMEVTNQEIRAAIETNEDLHAIADRLSVPYTRVRAIKAGMTRKQRKQDTAASPTPTSNVEATPLAALVALRAKRGAIVAEWESATAALLAQRDHQLDVLDEAIAILEGRSV